MSNVCSITAPWKQGLPTPSNPKLGHGTFATDSGETRSFMPAAQAYYDRKGQLGFAELDGTIGVLTNFRKLEVALQARGMHLTGHYMAPTGRWSGAG